MKSPEDICADFPEWPTSWKGLDEDVEYGKSLIEVLRPFVEHLIGTGLKNETIRYHMDNLWLLGGEIIRNVSLYEEYSIPANEKLKDSVDLNGGPRCRHLTTEAEIKSFDATCRKLHKFLGAIT
ncbi:MAG: hypothetical protein JRJ43_06505 [Deltaproteobacteria bacterium]|nr:hypothetical protein [Deltaproteobacteria bacterium]MBW1719200.1 hypothetical protein [Deltaproteobacteria bacterium]MBW2080691.1 hypothetical protein [Deltaproteobacteria bacterium]